MMGSDPLKEDVEQSPPSTATSTARPKTSGGRKPMKAKRNPELSRENSEEAPKVTKQPPGGKLIKKSTSDEGKVQNKKEIKK